MKPRIFYLIIFAILISISIGVVTIDARSSISNTLVKDDGTFKMFEDGLTYDDDGITIVLEDGRRIDCSYSWSPLSYRGYLNPICVEIIMRSIP